MTTAEHRRDTARTEWTRNFDREWVRLTGVELDPEYPSVCSSTLHPIMCHRPAEEAAREYFQATDDTNAWETDPKRVLTLLATKHGLIKEGAAIPFELLDFAQEVGELCAFIGDRHRDPHTGCAGDAIRARYGKVPF
jgi:hypothetical protein